MHATKIADPMNVRSISSPLYSRRQAQRPWKIKDRRDLEGGGIRAIPENTSGTSLTNDCRSPAVSLIISTRNHSCQTYKASFASLDNSQQNDRTHNRKK